MSQNPLNNGQRLLLTPEFSSSIWTTYQLPKNSRSAAESATPPTCS